MSIYIHTTADGKEIPITEMSNKHLINVIKFIERTAEKGIEKYYADDYFAWEAEDLFFDIDVLYGEDVLKAMHYDEYIKEAKRRGLLGEEKP